MTLRNLFIKLILYHVVKYLSYYINAYIAAEVVALPKPSIWIPLPVTTTSGLAGAVAAWAAVKSGSTVTLSNTGVAVVAFAASEFGAAAVPYTYTYVIVLLVVSIFPVCNKVHPLPMLFSVYNGVFTVVPVDA